MKKKKRKWRRRGTWNEWEDEGQNLEKEIASYEHDREALMEFGNEADQRECQAQSRVLEFERNFLLLMDELKKHKHQNDLMITNFFFQF